MLRIFVTSTQFTRASALFQGFFYCDKRVSFQIRRLASTEPFRKVFPCEGVDSGIRQAAFSLPETKVNSQ